MGDIMLRFGKSRVRPHVRASKTGKNIAVGEYATTRPPGKAKQRVIYSMGQLADMTAEAALRARAAACHHDMRAGGRQTCACDPCRVWRALKARKDYHGRTTFQKASDRLDRFLRKYWRKATDLFKAESTPSVIPLAADLASARDNGPADDIAQGHEQLPLAADDHAAAPPRQDDRAPAELEQLVKARVFQQTLQAEIAALDQRLAQDMNRAERGQLLATHLDLLVKVDALTGRLEDAECVRRGEVR